jgi:hypothetical protein
MPLMNAVPLSYSPGSLRRAGARRRRLGPFVRTDAIVKSQPFTTFGKKLTERRRRPPGSRGGARPGRDGRNRRSADQGRLVHTGTRARHNGPSGPPMFHILERVTEPILAGRPLVVLWRGPRSCAGRRRPESCRDSRRTRRRATSGRSPAVSGNAANTSGRVPPKHRVADAAPADRRLPRSGRRARSRCDRCPMSSRAQPSTADGSAQALTLSRQIQTAERRLVDRVVHDDLRSGRKKKGSAVPPSVTGEANLMRAVSDSSRARKEVIQPGGRIRAPRETGEGPGDCRVAEGSTRPG